MPQANPSAERNPRRAARRRLGLSLLALADECSRRGAPLSEGQASRIERGADPRPALRKVYAEVLGLDPDTLDEPVPETAAR